MGDAARRLVLAKNLPLSMSLGTTDKSQSQSTASSQWPDERRAGFTEPFLTSNGGYVGDCGPRHWSPECPLSHIPCRNPVSPDTTKTRTFAHQTLNGRLR